MARLTDDQKRHIVLELAMFKTPTEVVESLKDTFGVEIHRRQVHEYDPTGSKAHDVAAKWKALHKAARENFLKQTTDIPVANQAYRLMRLNAIADKARIRGALTLEAQTLEQCAKECGEAFTNRHKMEGNISHTHEGWLASLPPPPARKAG